MVEWICANCGERHQQNKPPCRKCAHETFARIESDETDRIGPTTDVTYRCKKCGREHQRNNPPCNNCGAMQLETIVEEPDTNEFAATSTSTDGGATAKSGSGGLFRNYVFDASHVQLWVWVVTAIAIFALPGLGLVMAVILLYSCIHKTDSAGEPLTPPGQRKSGARVLLSAFFWAFVVTFAIGFVLGILLL